MAGSKKRVDHVAWQIEVSTNEEWEELLKMQGLAVVDVYSEWCGPCTAMASHLKEIKLQLGDDLLHCAIAKSDGINQLAKFRGRSEPTWLFLASGEPVALVRGANAPLIRTTLLQELEAEKQVLEGTRQRVVMEWESFDLGTGEHSDEKPSESTPETDKLPDNWTELDALILQGSFRLLLDRLVQSCLAHPLEIVHRSAVQLDHTDSLILWFPTTLEEDKLVEWVDTTMNELIAEVEPKPELEPAAKETTESISETAEVDDKTEEQPAESIPEEQPEAPEYFPITFRLVTDHSEKEALIQKVTVEAAEAAAEAEAAAAKADSAEQATEEANQPTEEPSAEDQVDEPKESEESEEKQSDEQQEVQGETNTKDTESAPTDDAENPPEESPSDPS